ncbi:M14 family zinc carboxypeptidase [Flagellimonas nanhaiensis]|uniref:Peptidase M14 n=1 Tax=Flagellimonas nanhaiensis TaxID=2292706 RepID=A0A371JUV4_9FLAO|nr:M14 family zinc carboxypeptidase [Allomuricauda nanhaiensis]RDY61594.1 peptidase M14 [Allomuricauda nanhaiensis]
MLTRILLLLLAITTLSSNAQDLTSNLYETYATYKEPSLNKRRIKHHQIQPLIQNFQANPKFHVKKVGESIEGRGLHLISIGSGSINVFLWSQMHGNEPTATQAIFDILNFLDAPEFEEEKQEILSNLTLHFLPMLNPDGAEVFQRRNTLGIDINRDALRLQSPEGRTLKRVRDSLEADFGFNLHDQSTYYNAELTDKPATISYLATAFNYEKDINEIRSNAMKVIVYMNNIIQKYAPGQVGRYSDDFEPRAFGDNIAKWGTSLILIESGGYANDREKQEIRKLNYVSILSALYTIAKDSYKNIPIEDYEKIPRNDRKLFDLKIENVTYELLGKDYILDLGIHRQEVDLEGHNHFYYKSSLVDQGDLSTYFGYETFDASGYKVVAPKIYPRSMNTNTRALWNAEGSPFKSGYGYFKTDFLPPIPYSELPGHFISDTYTVPDFILKPGVNPTFFLEKGGVLTHAVINGFLIDLSKPIEDQNFGNALILR